MSRQEGEWVSISDLMSGVVAVIVLLFVIATVQKTIEQLKAKEESRARLQAKRSAIRELMAKLAEDSKKEGVKDLVLVDQEKNMILLREATFEIGDACLRNERPILWIRPTAREFLAKFPHGMIQVEGHTDSTPVGGLRRSKCGAFEDNFSLSSLRAFQARKVLVEGWAQEAARRVAVAGHASDRLLLPTQPADPANRRVEIRFLENAIDEEASP